MLWVYAGLDLTKTSSIAKLNLPTNSVDLSKVVTSDLSKTVHDFCNHNKRGHMYLGYLDPLLMLHPTDETLLRRGFTECDMTIVVSNPRILPRSWKNGITYLKVIEFDRNVELAKVVNNGGTPHIQDETEHRRTSSQTSDQRDSDKSGKTGSPPKRRKQTRQDKAS